MLWFIGSFLTAPKELKHNVFSSRQFSSLKILDPSEPIELPQMQAPRKRHLGAIYPNGTVEFLSKVHEALKNQSFTSIYIGIDHKKSVAELKSVRGRYVQLKKLMVQFCFSHLTNEKVANFPPDDVSAVVESILSTNFANKIFLETQEFKYELFPNKMGGKLQCTPIFNQQSGKPTDFQHDRQKNTLISVNEPFLQALKVTTTERDHASNPQHRKSLLVKPLNSSVEARPRTGMADKYRQIVNFVEILDGLVRRSPLSHSDEATRVEPLKIVDMGSGLAYLTFAVHRHFSKRFPRLVTVGVEGRSALVTQTERIARSLGSDFEGLSFIQANIIDYINLQPRNILDCDYDAAGINSKATLKSGMDILIALHACDQATDEAIFCGIQSGASIIVTAPCCHKELRAQLEQSLKGTHSPPALTTSPLRDLLTHGLFRERESEMITGA